MKRNIKKNNIARYFLLILITLLPQISVANTLYVDDINDGQLGSGTLENPYRDLQYAIDAAHSGDLIHIKAGRYTATPVHFVDPTCGNCDPAEFHQDIPATRGFLISGKSLSLVGESNFETTLITNAGYGVLFENAGASSISQVTITGGKRDPEEKATNGALVVKNTVLDILNVDLHDNNDLHPELIIGVAGIVGRENAKLNINNVSIQNSSWDGIALYQSSPTIENAIVEASINKTFINGGRGTGIGVTWNAQAVIKNVEIANFWKGVGAFGTAQVKLYNSNIHDNWAWGVLAYDHASIYAANNIVTRMGTTGMIQWSPEAKVSFINNIVFDNGRVAPPEEGESTVGPRAGIMISNLSNSQFKFNNVYNNPVNFCEDHDPCLPVNFTGANGNISSSLTFADSETVYWLECNHPGIDAGSPDIIDLDNSRSDMGLYGGPFSIFSPPDCFVELAPLPISYSATVLEEGIPVTFSSGVINQGTKHSGSFDVLWQVDDIDYSKRPHSAVLAGTTSISTASKLKWTPIQGKHRISLTIDDTNQIHESDEGNNTSSIIINVIAPRADLSATPIMYNLPDLVRGQKIIFDAGVANNRPVPSPAFNVRWYVDGIVMRSSEHAPIPAFTTVPDGQSKFAWKAVPGIHSITFEVDSNNMIDESSELNNKHTINILVK